MTPVAIIPMFTPEEAIEELDHAVRRARLQGGDAAELREAADRAPSSTRAGGRPFAWRADTFGIDSEHDYDPVWAKCRELGVVASFHGPGRGLDLPRLDLQPGLQPRRPLRDGATAICKSLFLGGVSQRFPELRFLFLEGGVGWAPARCSPISPATGRSAASRDSHATAILGSPTSTSSSTSTGNTAVRCGGRRPREELAQRWDVHPEDPTRQLREPADPSTEELRRLFVDRFYFGCEGDDPVMPSAFDVDRNPGRRAPARHLRLGHRPLGRPADGGGARGGVRAARGRHARRRPTCGTSCSPTRCGSGRRRTRTSSTAPSSSRPSPRPRDAD